jgi:AcrR family transcriptional regulator
VRSDASKRQHILVGATAIFSRYGYARTTMGDIAAEAGMSRPALYLLFPDKEALFTAVIRHMDEEKQAEIRSGLKRYKGLHAKLLYACQSWGSHGFDLAAVHPDAADLFDLRFAPVKEVYANFETFVFELIRERVLASGIEATAEELARALAYGMRGLRATATSGQDMRRLIAVQVTILMRAIGVRTSNTR